MNCLLIMIVICIVQSEFLTFMWAFWLIKNLISYTLYILCRKWEYKSNNSHKLTCWSSGTFLTSISRAFLISPLGQVLSGSTVFSLSTLRLAPSLKLVTNNAIQYWRQRNDIEVINKDFILGYHSFMGFRHSINDSISLSKLIKWSMLISTNTFEHNNRSWETEVVLETMLWLTKYSYNENGKSEIH